VPPPIRRAAEYDRSPYAGLAEQSLKGLASLEPADADVVNGVADRVSAEMFRRIGLEDLLHPTSTSARSRVF